MRMAVAIVSGCSRLYPQRWGRHRGLEPDKFWELAAAVSGLVFSETLPISCYIPALPTGIAR